jgi:hypothetical protein
LLRLGDPACKGDDVDDSGLQDLSTLALPDEAVKWLESTSRTKSVFEHRVQVDPDWWTAALEESGLPGGPVRGDDTSGTSISRAHLFELAQPAHGGDDDVVLRLLWHTLAWGAGTKGRNNRSRVATVARQGPELVAETLRKAGQAAKDDPERAYQALRPSRKSAVPYLGPAFFTKYLYFAGGGADDHASLILDARVAASLRAHGWSSLGAHGWPPHSYARYCHLLHRWADEASERAGRRCFSDELEVWLFEPQASSSTNRA